MTIPPSIPDPAAALRSALKSFDPLAYTRNALKGFDPTAAARAVMADFDPAAARQATLRNFDPSAAARAAVADFDPAAATQATLRNFDVTAATHISARSIDVTALTEAALRTLDPSAALKRALASFAPTAIGQVELRTMSFQTGVDVLGILKRMSLTTDQVPAVPVPGFDAAVRDALTSAAAAIGASIDLPEGEIEYVAMPDPAISLSPEFEELAASAAERHQGTDWPQTARTTITWFAYIFLILSLTQEAAPTIHENDPTGVTDVVAEHWPEQAQLPDWFVDIYLLAFAIQSARPRSTGGSESN